LTLTLRAPAKINLALHVTGQRADGYHLLDSLVVFTKFGDELGFEAADMDGLVIDGPFALVLSSDDPAKNLVAKARTAMRNYGLSEGNSCPPVKIRLTKNLPIASGIGGGSSDAAAALLGLAQFWGLEVTADALAEIGIRLGADVPMCLQGQPLFARGVGDEIEIVPQFPELHLVLVNPGVGVSTPEVFERLETKTNTPLDPYSYNPSVEEFCDWLLRQRNDLEKPALNIQPIIGKALDALNQCGAVLARMSGSGATCFGIYRDAQSAEVAVEMIARDTPEWFVRAAQSGASSLADMPGPHSGTPNPEP
jgi:4-diphosphocytidyl-2-C-methyl-D-erythritol kinase